MVETGNHDELVAMPDGLYASLVRATEHGSTESAASPTEGGAAGAALVIEINA